MCIFLENRVGKSSSSSKLLMPPFFVVVVVDFALIVSTTNMVSLQCTQNKKLTHVQYTRRQSDSIQKSESVCRVHHDNDDDDDDD